MTSSRHKYEFGGPVGAAGIVFGLPLLMYFLYFGCNGKSGCPIPALLNPSTVSWEGLRSQTPWPEAGLRGFITWHSFGWTIAYYVLSLMLYRLLPAHEVYGTKLREYDRPLKYRMNAFSSTIVQVVACAIGTYLHGANFVVWKYIDENYLQLLTSNILLSFAISIFVYIRSYDVKTGNKSMRLLAEGGQTGSLIYDFFIGRELNPRVRLLWIGEVDAKTWLEMRPGLTGWLLLNLAFVAKQYRNYGFLSNSIMLVCGIQAYYVLEGQYAEPGILAMMDITTDGLGFMLTFGDIVWVPFLYSTQSRYLSVHPVDLSHTSLVIMAVIFALGLYIFRATNSQKATFRATPNHPSVSNLSYIQTRRGTKLITSGWWGMARHINYFGDWLQSLPFCLPTALAGYLVLDPGAADVAGLESFAMLDGTRVFVGKEVRGMGMFFTYFYAVWFAIMLIHRERRDDAMCQAKYGEYWTKYKQLVKWRIIPGIY